MTFMVAVFGFAMADHNSAQQPCMVISLVKIDCTGRDLNVCKYSFTIDVTNNTGVAGTMTLTSNAGGTVSPSSVNINPGANPNISVTLNVPCGTPSIILKGHLPLQPPPKFCDAGLPITLPPCPCPIVATAHDQTICKGGSTQIDLPITTQGNILWYYAPAPCPSTTPPNGWTALSGGTTWYTLQLDQSTCYQAIVTNLVGCPSGIGISNPVLVNVIAPPAAGSITCTVGGNPCPANGELCSGSVVNLSYTNPNPSNACSTQWQKLVGSTWQNIGSATIPAQTLVNAACPFAPVSYRVVYSCGMCGSDTPTISFKVYAPTSVGALTATKPTICEGDDDILKLANSCGKVIQWESSPTGLAGSFVAIPGSAGATVWYTNQINQPPPHDAWYQVSVQNGPCNLMTSNVVHIILNKKPSPVVSPPGPVTFCAPGHVILTETNPNGGTCKWYYNGLATSSTSTTYSATASGNYYVVCTNGCGTTKSNIVKVTASKIVAAIQGPCGVCLPNCINLQALLPTGGVPPYTYTWTSSPPMPPVPGPTLHTCPTVNTTYILKVTDSVGCTTTVSQTVNICP